MAGSDCGVGLRNAQKKLCDMKIVRRVTYSARGSSLDACACSSPNKVLSTTGNSAVSASGSSKRPSDRIVPLRITVGADGMLPMNVSPSGASFACPASAAGPESPTPETCPTVCGAGSCGGAPTSRNGPALRPGRNTRRGSRRSGRRVRGRNVRSQDRSGRRRPER